MNITLSMSKLGTLAALFALGLSVAGCATEALQKREAIEQRIAGAKTRADHEGLAAWYEQEAQAAGEQAANHRRMIKRYELERYAKYFTRPHGTGAGFAEQCQNLARRSEQAAEDNLALAKLHRRMAAEAKE